LIVGSSGANRGMEVFSGAHILTIVNNTIKVSGTGSGEGIRISAPSENNSIRDNNVTYNSTGSQAFGIRIGETSAPVSRTNVTGNRVFVRGTSSISGIFVGSLAQGARLVLNNNITVVASSTDNQGIFMEASNDAVVSGNIVTVFGTLTHGINLDGVDNVTAVGNNLTVFGTNSFALLIFQSNSTFINTTLKTNAGWFNGTLLGAGGGDNVFNNTEFKTAFGSITVFGPVSPSNGTINVSHINISQNRAILECHKLN